MGACSGGRNNHKEIQNQPTDKVAGALAYLWTQREPHQSLEYLELIAKPYAYPGGKIEQYFRTVRDFCIAGSGAVNILD